MLDPIMVLRILLAQAEVEPIPKEIRDHKAVLAHAKRVERPTGGLLLDQNVHKAAMKDLEDTGKRGRPDIAHHCLLHLLEHPLSKTGKMEVALHTRQGDLIRFHHETRLPRGETRFQGVIAKVLKDKPNQEASSLVWHDGRMNAQQAIDKFGVGPVIRLDEGGDALSPLQIADRAQNGELTIVIGAFSFGDWTNAWQKAAPNTASIWPEALNAWVVGAEITAAWRTRYGPTTL